MFECKMIVNKLNIHANKLTIGAVISCPFDIDVTSPKAKIVFSSNGETRRLPLRVVNYFRQKQEESCVVVCNYTYLLDSLFFEFEPQSPITAKIDFYYGDNSVLGIPFLISTNVTKENPHLDLPENYIEYESFDGTAVIDIPDTEYENENGCDYTYEFGFDFENNGILIFPKLQTDTKHNFLNKSKIIIPFFRFIAFILRMCACILLSPYLVIDGILAGVGIVPKRKTAEFDSISHNIYLQIKINFSSFLKTSFKRSNFVENITRPIFTIFNWYHKVLSKKDVVQNRVTFMSGRRDTLGGNPEYVYNVLKDDTDIEFCFLLFSDPDGHYKLKNMIKFVKLYSSSKVVIVDDYFRLLNMVPKRKQTKLIQLWHACGAFKTFGFTRLGKPGGPKQTDPNHRMYDAAVVSSSEIIKHYAEGFGLSDNKIVATGVPRTDIFMDELYKETIKNKFYQKRPNLKDKKIVLFAPTFRGNGQMSAFYPSEAFQADEFYEALGNDYALIIKYHPFCEERTKISEKYKDVILDLSDEDELNDLLFVTDLLITDYSSVIFEASLLNIPMLFYAFDLFDYISKRDFYYDFENFVPGKIVFSQTELTEAIQNNDFESEKINEFKSKFFEHLDGKSTLRVTNLVKQFLSE